MRAPKGPAAANAPPEPKNNPVPMVPAIYIVNTKLSDESQKKIVGKPTAILRSIISLVPSGTGQGLHLNMTLLETSLDTVKVMDIEVESMRQ